MQPLSDVFSSTPNGSNIPKTTEFQKLQSPKPHAFLSRNSPSPPKLASPKRNIFSPKPAGQSQTQDSGYYGSQDINSVQVYNDPELEASQPISLAKTGWNSAGNIENDLMSRTAISPPGKIDQFHTSPAPQSEALFSDATEAIDVVDADGDEIMQDTSPLKVHEEPTKVTEEVEKQVEQADSVQEHRSDPMTDDAADEAASSSEGSSPIRPVVRKSSLNFANFASLPAREPLTAGKSTGGRGSRNSQLDSNRMSHYSRQTGGKSLGNRKQDNASDQEDEEMADDMDKPPVPPPKDEDVALNHNKTYTQRLQDQINLLGKPQSTEGRPTKSITSAIVKEQNTILNPMTPAPPKSSSPLRKDTTKTTPGAFPEEDDEDDWIEPPATVTTTVHAPLDIRPPLPKSHTTDIMEGLQNTEKISSPTFAPAEYEGSPQRSQRGMNMRSHLAATFSHGKSASVTTLPNFTSIQEPQGLPLSKATTIENGGVSTPSKFASRSFRESPLKQVKNKLSSILKSSRSLLASSAAVSAEGKSSILSPSTTRLGFHPSPSKDSIFSKSTFDSQKTPTSQFTADSNSVRPIARRTRASAEREKDEKRREKEEKRMAEQMEKLEKAREDEREKARVFSKEQERLAEIERQVAAQRSLQKPTLIKETPKPIRSSPRKAKAPETVATDAMVVDTEAAETASMVPPPSVPRSVGPSQSIPRKELKRPTRPTKDTQPKQKQAPTVIRVNMGYAGSSAAAGPSQEPMQAAPQSQKATTAKPPLQAKASSQSLRSTAPPSSSKSKPAEAAARKKEQEERDAQRRRDAKAETDKKRALDEQRKQEQQRKQEAEKQKLREQEASQPEGGKNAQRQAAIEKAKQTRAPPPAPRSQPNGPPDFAIGQEKQQPARPQSRMGDTGRVGSAAPSTASKAGLKRTIAVENEPNHGTRPPSRNGPSYQAKDAKRRRTSEDHRDEFESQPSNIKGPPVRPSQGFKKVRAKTTERVPIAFTNSAQDGPPKAIFQQPPSATRDLFKATVTGQHSAQAKAAHPLDMAQISKGAIPFGPNPNSASFAQKTPARPGQPMGPKSAAKSTAKPSPKFQNGELIELPEIDTDDEDEDEDESHGMVAAWADSPDLRRALMRQETMDPSRIFGPPAPLNMEEVFSKNKERWTKFRARTSSANWSGADRLTEEDVRKDLLARDKLRRDGAWSYEMSRDMA